MAAGPVDIKLFLQVTEISLGGCPRTGVDRFVAPAKPALPPSMAVVARESGFEAIFSILRGE